MLKERLIRVVKDALSACRAEDLLPDVGVPVSVTWHGDCYVTDAPLLLARRTENTVASNSALAGVYAEHLAERINAHPDSPAEAKASMDGSLTLSPSTALYAEAVQAITEAGDTWGTNPGGIGKRALVEFVSANPNTPLSLHHARGAAIGDAISNLLGANGYSVDREFYINDAASGPQLRSLARAVFAAYRQKFGASSGDGADGYSGTYVTDLSDKIAETHGDSFKDLSPEAAATAFAPMIVSLMQKQQEETLEAFGVRFDRWFAESTLLSEGALQKVMDALMASGNAYAQGGAMWLRTTAFGDDGDRVLLRNDGTPSYFAGDLAYHLDKLRTRAYDLVVDVWNADHESYAGRTRAGLSALGIPDVSEHLRIAVFGPVRPMQDGSELRTGRIANGMVTLSEVLEAGVDTNTLRFALLAASDAPAPMDLSMDTLAAGSRSNPLTPIRAALARTSATDTASDEAMDSPAYNAVVRQVDAFAGVVRDAALHVAPGELARYAAQLAAAINALPSDATGAGLSAANQTLRNALRLLGIVAA